MAVGALSTVAEEVARHLDTLVATVVGAIRAEIGAYADGAVSEQDLTAAVELNLEAVLAGLVAERGPQPDEVRSLGELGTRRALQGLPVDALLQAYHIGYRELWQALVAEVLQRRPETAAELLGAATTVWRWVHELSDAIARAHATTSRSLEAQAIGARQRLAELIEAGDLDDVTTVRLVRSLGFDPDGRFQVVVVRELVDDLETVTIQHALDPLEGRAAVAARASDVVVITQATDPDALTAALRTAAPGATLGVGLARASLRGARASLLDAEQTLTVTPLGTTGRFEDRWIWATLAAAGDRLAPLLAAGAEAAAAHPHLAAAVRAYAASGFSVADAARSLGLHANSVAYRLDRWELVTGFDPRTLTGLVRSLAAAGAAGAAEIGPGS